MKDSEIEQFLQDESFLSYCFNRNEQDVRYWENWLSEHPEDMANIKALKERLLLTTSAAVEKMKQQHFSELQVRINASRKGGRNYLKWRYRAAAASIILLFCVSGYFLLHKKGQFRIAIHKKDVQDIQPGGNKATLILGNGQQVALADASKGSIAQQGSAMVNKTADGQIVYNDSRNTQLAVTKPLMNTIATPRGGQWFVTLSDGTKVWLNAASSITYPVTFTGTQRIVSITGEAYFEVVHNAAKPFKVQVGNMLVQDIGTAFNINAYPDEPAIKTTLVNGSAKVSQHNEAHILIPGQQAIVKANSILIKKVNIEDIIGWKNGEIYFENEDLEAIMRQVSRWYDVNVVYQGAIPNRAFAGGISRNSNLSELIKILEYENVHCTLNGKTVIIAR